MFLFSKCQVIYSPEVLNSCSLNSEICLITSPLAGYVSVQGADERTRAAGVELEGRRAARQPNRRSVRAAARRRRNNVSPASFAVQRKKATLNVEVQGGGDELTRSVGPTACDAL